MHHGSRLTRFPFFTLDVQSLISSLTGLDYVITDREGWQIYDSVERAQEMMAASLVATSAINALSVHG